MSYFSFCLDFLSAMKYTSFGRFFLVFFFLMETRRMFAELKILLPTLLNEHD